MSDVSERSLTGGNGSAPVDSAVIEGRAQAVATHVHGVAPQEAPARPAYVGLVTRTIAFVVDAAVIDAVAALVGVAIALILSLLPGSDKHQSTLVAIGVVVFFIWAATYFVVFWSTTGQTPGSRLMEIRVVPAGAHKLGAVRACMRVIALVAAILPLGAGTLPILFTPRRRGLQDFVASTVVVSAPGERSRLR